MRILWLLLAATLLPACADIPSPASRLHAATKLADAKGWRMERIDTGNFSLTAWRPRRFVPSERLTIYIEGDGFAWITGSQPSPDPTPIDPLALRLALAQPDGNAAYLARPCQFAEAETRECAQTYWTGERFAPAVIEAAQRAIDVLKNRAGARRLTLVGYSGGGAVAALVAAERKDVDRLVTVAGNLDHRRWTALHRVSPLTGSRNAADVSGALGGIRQWHFVGGEDQVIPPQLAQSFADRFPAANRPRVIVEADYDHRCCWADGWSRLWQKTQFQPAPGAN